MTKPIFAVLSASLLASACATPYIATISHPTDHQLSCEQLVNEIEIAESLKRGALDERGANGRNVLAAVFFWPALFATYENVHDAVDAAEDRMDHLIRIYRDKDCPIRSS